MIFVTVGGMRAFDRLVIAMDRLAGELDEEVVMQIGSTEYEPGNCKYFKFLPSDEMKELYARARVVICHAGIGSILSAAQYNKPLILVPRTKRYGEHIDDHQLEIAREMESRGMTVLYDIDTGTLKAARRNPNANPPKLGTGANLAGALKEYLDQLDSRSGRP